MMPSSSSDRDLFSEISVYVPESHLSAFWSLAAYLRQLPPDDEVLRVCQAMGVLTLITRQIPTELIAERKELRRMFGNIHAEMALSEKSIQTSVIELRQIASTIAGNAETVRRSIAQAGEVTTRTVGDFSNLVTTAKGSVQSMAKFQRQWRLSNIAAFVLIAVMLCTGGIAILMNRYCEDKIRIEIAKVNQRAETNAEAFRKLNSIGKTITLKTDGNQWQLIMPDADSAWTTVTQSGVIAFTSNR